mmetsp:Transcript_4189/g.11998  ORF Transcript_4189/g.11998 Transcript_4189/m.11998 type:complete len:272 (+) Transcript_4189:389-1204(+)
MEAGGSGLRRGTRCHRMDAHRRFPNGTALHPSPPSPGRPSDLEPRLSRGPGGTKRPRLGIRGARRLLPQDVQGPRSDQADLPRVSRVGRREHGGIHTGPGDPSKRRGIHRRGDDRPGTHGHPDPRIADLPRGSDLRCPRLRVGAPDRPGTRPAAGRGRLFHGCDRVEQLRSIIRFRLRPRRGGGRQRRPGHEVPGTRLPDTAVVATHAGGDPPGRVFAGKVWPPRQGSAVPLRLSQGAPGITHYGNRSIRRGPVQWIRRPRSLLPGNERPG